MFSFLYYVTIIYCSVFFLSILDKINKGKIKNKDDLKKLIMSKCFIILSKYHKIKRISNETYRKCLTYNKLNKESEEEINLYVYSNNKKIDLKMTIQNNKIKLNDEIPDEILDENVEDVKLYMKYKSFFKEMNDVNLNDLKNTFEKLPEEIENFMNDKFLIDDKLFLNIELVNGRNSETLDLTNIVQKYFVEGNIIFTKQFLEYILKYDFNEKLNYNYSLNIMTKDVEMLRLSNTQKIKITKTDQDKLTHEILN